MRNFFFIFLISSLCFVVISCAEKEETTTSSISTNNTSSTDNTSVSIVDGSAEGYIKIGNMLMVWGDDGVPDVAKEFPKSFISKPTAYFDCGGGTWTSSTITNSSGDCNPYGFFAVGKWE